MDGAGGLVSPRKRSEATSGRSITSAVENPILDYHGDDEDASNSNNSTNGHAVTWTTIEPFEIDMEGGRGESDDGKKGGDDDEDLIHPLVGDGSAHNRRDHAGDDDIHDGDDDNNYKKTPHHHGGGGDDHHITAPPGSASTVQVIINIVISFVGAGLLGIPNAFMKSGWLLGSITLLVVSVLNVYAMLCLPAVQGAIRKTHPNEVVDGYGDLGRIILGSRGETVIFICLGISQAGFATAYIIFIAANIKSIFHVPRVLVCLGCVPVLAGLVQFRDLKSLSPFSLLANTANFCALSAVLFQDYESYTPHNDTIHKIKWDGLIYVIAITIYSMEGVGLILSLKSSCKKPETFSFLVMSTLTAISLFMVLFGSCGYWAFGDKTEAPITLNLTNHWSAVFVKCALCLGLYLTYPIMMFPVWAIVETHPFITNGPEVNRIILRTSAVCCSALVAYAVPNFGKFLSLVGSSICTLLGFVFPSYFHLWSLGKDLPIWQKGLDCFLLVGGFLFGLMGTYQSFMAMLEGELEGEVRRRVML
jgi:proton-coupled amino acid transporter